MKEIVTEILEKELLNSPLFLVDVQASSNRIEVFLDADNNITLEDCSTMNRLLHKRMEEQEIDTGKYFIDVSSPGIGRELKSLREIKKNVGRKTELRTKANKLLKGMLGFCNAEKIMIVTGTKQLKAESFLLTEIKELKVTI